MRRGSLAAFCVAAAAVSGCQGSGPAITAIRSEPATAPPADFCTASRAGCALRADASNYREMTAGLRPGDTLVLAPGDYAPLTIANLNGAPGDCIVVSGPGGDRPAVILGESGRKTVEIVGSSYVVVRNLVIDSRGMPGADGVKAPASPQSATHHIVLDSNLIVGAGYSQQTDGITTKTPTWNWIIRGNTILSAGTALYLGDSDGTSPFIAGLIENNRVIDPIGYGMQIKYQVERPVLPGMPQDPQRTVIRNNLFKKSGRPSPDGDRPNLLVGGFPEHGPCADDIYEIYGNLLVDNPREALFQGSGRISFHDNILIGGHPAAALFRDHDLPLKWAEVFDNKIYAPQIGIQFGSPARQGRSVSDNVIVAETPVAGLGPGEGRNIVFEVAGVPASAASSR